MGGNVLSKELQEILVCPKCKGELVYRKQDDELVCNACRLIYSVDNDIPVMLIDKAKKF